LTALVSDFITRCQSRVVPFDPHAATKTGSVRPRRHRFGRVFKAIGKSFEQPRSVEEKHQQLCFTGGAAGARQITWSRPCLPTAWTIAFL
jgi:hypothetical protein